MQQASQGALFVWCNSHLSYPNTLAKQLGREDLQIVSPSFLEDKWQGREYVGVVVDHAAYLTEQQLRGLQGIVSRVRKLS